MLVADQLSALVLYLPPVFVSWNVESVPPQTIISLPLQIAVCPTRPSGALAVLVGVQLLLVGLYFAPVVR